MSRWDILCMSIAGNRPIAAFGAKQISDRWRCSFVNNPMCGAFEKLGAGLGSRPREQA